MTAGRRRSMEEFLQQQRAMEAGDDDTGAGPPAPTAGPAVISPGSLPDPYTAAGDGQLSGREQADLATCEAALDNLRVAFWAAGKALQVIRDARLYRDTHATFEDYVEQRWDMSRSQAYRLVDAWPLAERLSPMGDKLNERQIRELLPLADRHGQDAAVTVYRTVAETEGIQVTAALLHGAVRILPAGRFDPAEAIGQIRAYLAGNPGNQPRPAANPVETFATEAAKLLRVLHRVSARGVLQAALDADPERSPEGDRRHEDTARRNRARRQRTAGRRRNQPLNGPGLPRRRSGLPESSPAARQPGGPLAVSECDQAMTSRPQAVRDPAPGQPAITPDATKLRLGSTCKP